MLNQFRWGLGQFQVNFNVFRLFGTDVKKFLQVQSTYDTDSLLPQSFHLISFLDSSGRVETYGWLLKTKNDYLYLAPEKLASVTKTRLEKFLVSEDVTIEGPDPQDWLVIIGSKIIDYKTEDSFYGEMFADQAFLEKRDFIPGVSILNDEEISSWQGLSGWPSFSAVDFQSELINNLRLFDLSLVMNKGCYPGQETVSKIATRRGAAYSPVLIEVSEKLSPGTILNFEKKIGEAKECYEWNGKHFLAANLIRDFRVQGLNIQFSLNQKDHSGVVYYYPLLPGSNQDKANELYYLALEHFKRDDFHTAEEYFRLAIDLNPKFADAYESLGVLLGRLDRYDEAIGFMKQLSQVDPHSVLAHTNWSLFLMKQGKIEEAEEQKSFATVKSFQKFGEEAKNKEQEALQKKEKLEEWIKRESMFKQVLEIDPEDTLANYGLGSIAVEKAEWEKAKIYLEKVILADMNYSVAYLALGKAYKSLGQFEMAKKVFKDGISIAAKKGDLMPANQMQTELERL